MNSPASEQHQVIVRSEWFGGLAYDKTASRFFSLSREAVDFLLGKLPGGEVPPWAGMLVKAGICDSDFSPCGPVVVHPGERPKYGLGSPLKVFLEVTSYCNLRCQHCFNRSGKRIPAESTAAELARLADELASIGLFELTLTGGEPLARPDFFDLAQVFSRHSYSLTVATNGTLVTSDVAARLAGLGVGRVTVSLDGERGSHDGIRGRGAFDRATLGIRCLVEAGIRTSISFTATRVNIAWLRHVVDTAADLGCGEIVVRGVVPAGRARYSWPALALLRDEYRRAVATAIEYADERAITVSATIDSSSCSAGTQVCTVGADLEVYSCRFLGKSLGNLRDSRMRQLWLGCLMSRGPAEARDGRVCSTCTTVGGCPPEYLHIGGLANHLAPSQGDARHGD